jgi:trigger factor
MQIHVQRVSPVMMELQIEVPADKVKLEVDKAYKNLAQKSRLRGFRPGKAPRSVLAHLFGPQVQNEVATAIVNDTLPKALTEKNVTPIATPQVVETGKLDQNGPFSYKARVEVQPEITDVKYEGFELVRPPTRADEKMVDEQIEHLRQRHAALKAPEPARPAQKGDVVTIDFTLSVDGKELKDGGGTGVQVELGGAQLVPELDKALHGKKVGEKAEAEVTFPDTHPSADLKGKKATFAVTVQDLKEKSLPNADDEFAKDVGQYQTLIELRADVHTKLEKAMKEQSDLALAEQIVTKLNEANPCEVPPTLVEQQFQVMAREIDAQARRAGQKFTQDQVKDLTSRLRVDAERKVRAGLVMAAIARQNGVQVTEADIEKGIQELAQETNKAVAKVKAEYRDANKRQILIGMILEDKILDLLESKSKITDAPAILPAAEEKKSEAATTA